MRSCLLALAERELAPRGRKSLEEIVVVGLPKFN